MSPAGRSRRAVMFLIVGAQVLVLGAIVVPQELNMALDSGVGVALEITDARAHKDPFRGAYVSGRSALDLDGAKAAMPAEALRSGEKVLVYFAAEAAGRPRIVRVERRGRGAGPPFTPTSFSIPGRVLGADGWWRGPRSGDLVARVGGQRVAVALEVPGSVPVDDAALDRIAWPSLVSASLHRGFLGHRYLAEVQLIGRAWSPTVSLAWDAAREHLVVVSPTQVSGTPRPASPRSEVFRFDGHGVEAGMLEVAGRLLGGVVAADGRVITLVSDDVWGYGKVSVATIREDGQASRQSPAIAIDHVLGLDPATGGAWLLTGGPTPRPEPPHYVEELTPTGARGPRLGPFTSVPSAIVASGRKIWIVETRFHRVTRVERASGHTEREYRDLNGPTDVAVEGGDLFVIEADRTQLTRLSEDGRVAWRVPRFQGLAWVLAEPGTGGCWVGAQAFEGRSGGVFRFGPDGRVTHHVPGVRPVAPTGLPRRLGADAVRDPRTGRLYVREPQAIVILGADGALIERILGFHYPQPQRVRS